MPRPGAQLRFKYPGEDVAEKETETDIRSPGVGRLGGVWLGRPRPFQPPLVSIFRGLRDNLHINLPGVFFGL